MESSDQNLNPELEQLIEVIVRALAQQNLPAVVLLPSDDLSVARAACAQLAEPEVSKLHSFQHRTF